MNKFQFVVVFLYLLSCNITFCSEPVEEKKEIASSTLCVKSLVMPEVINLLSLYNHLKGTVINEINFQIKYLPDLLRRIELLENEAAKQSIDTSKIKKIIDETNFLLKIVQVVCDFEKLLALQKVIMNAGASESDIKIIMQSIENDLINHLSSDHKNYINRKIYHDTLKNNLSI